MLQMKHNGSSRLHTRALARWREKWLGDRYDRIIQTRGRILNESVGHCQNLSHRDL